MGGWIQTTFGDSQAGVQHHEQMIPCWSDCID